MPYAFLHGAGGGGAQPTLYTPTITFNYGTKTLTVTDGNGSFAIYEIYYATTGDYALLSTITAKTVDLSTLITPTQNTSFKVKAVGADFKSSAFSNVVIWQYGVGSEGLSYTLLSGGTAYACSGIGTCTDTDIEIGSVHEGLPVIEISQQAFQQNTTITSVKIPASMEFINMQAFEYCTNMKTVEFAEGCTIMRTGTPGSGYQFANCHLQGTIKFPESITVFPAASFEGQQPDTGKFVKYIFGTQLTEIKGYAFRNTSRVRFIFRTVTPPTFGEYAFDHQSYNNYGFYVPYSGIEDYKIATNLVSYASEIYPLVSTVADLANIDTTSYTKACVIGNNEYTEYEYTNNQWEMIQ